MKMKAAPLAEWPLIILLLLLAPLAKSQETGLLLVDIQQFYFPGGQWQLEDPQGAGMNAGLLLEEFRNQGLKVYHIRHNVDKGGEFHPYVEPQPGEAVISKNEINPFLSTRLEKLLRTDSIDKLVICGMQTHLCVEAAVRAAHDLGFSCTLVSDACATRSLQFEEHIIPARYVHYSTLRSLADGYARIITTTELLRESKSY